jgi:hypothetical protein
MIRTRIENTSNVNVVGLVQRGPNAEPRMPALMVQWLHQVAAAAAPSTPAVEIATGANAISTKGSINKGNGN